MDHSQPGSSVHRILQARILEWIAVPSARGSSQPREVSCIGRVGPLPIAPPGKPRGLFIGLLLALDFSLPDQLC